MNLKDPSLLRQACLIGGQWTEADDKSVMAVANKATGETIGSVPGCGRAETERAAARSSSPTTRARGRCPTAGPRLGCAVLYDAPLCTNIDD